MNRIVIAASIAATLSLASCADEAPGGPGASPGGDSGAIEHPTGPSEIVLQLSYEGGFVPVEWAFGAVPAFTLYGDGTVVVPGAQIEIYPGPALPSIWMRAADDDAVRALIERALDAGLGEGDLDLVDTGQPLVADASTAVFTLSADGRTTVARVYALGLETGGRDGINDEQLELRRSLTELAADLTDLSWLPARSLGAEEEYVGDAARLLVRPHRPDPELPQEPIDWTVAVDLAKGGEPYADGRCIVVDGEAWGSLREVATGANQLTPWVAGGEAFAIAFRPLLPHETGC